VLARFGSDTYNCIVRRSLGIIGAALLGAFVAIDVRIATRLDIGGDTLVINGLQPVLLGVRAFNWHGLEIPKPRLMYSGLPSSLAHASADGQMRCKSTGDATLTIAHGALVNQLLVRCRPIMAFGPHQSVDLELGGPPDTLTIDPIGYDRRPVTLLRGQAKLRDSSVAQLRGNLLYPVKVGCDLIDVEFSGGSSTTASVCVKRTVIDSSLRLVGGEIRTIDLAPGNYHIRLDAKPPTPPRLPLTVAVMRASCARGPEGPQDYYCTTTDSSMLVVANKGEPGSGVQAGHLLVRQQPRHSESTRAVATADPRNAVRENIPRVP
jgi:hypothetical protein